MLRASLVKVVHTVKRAGTYAAKVPPQELHKIAVHVRAVGKMPIRIIALGCDLCVYSRCTQLSLDTETKIKEGDSQ